MVGYKNHVIFYPGQLYRDCQAVCAVMTTICPLMACQTGHNKDNSNGAVKQ